jgi:hypothetical protein
VLLISISGLNAIAQTVSDKALDSKALAALVEELKGVVSREAHDEEAAKAVAAKWDARKDLTGKSRKAVINLLYGDVKSVITDSGVQYQIYQDFSLYKQMPEESFSGQPEKTNVVAAQSGPDKPLDAKSLTALVTELKGVVSREAHDEKAPTAIAARWDARKDLTGKTKKAVINLLFQDVKSVIKDSGILYQIYQDFSLYKQMPDESFSGNSEKTEAPKQSGADNALNAKSVAGLVEELKGVVSREAHDEQAAKAVAAKWDARKDLTGKTKKAVINLLFQDVKAVIKDSGIQYSIYSDFSLYKQIP